MNTLIPPTEAHTATQSSYITPCMRIDEALPWCFSFYTHIHIYMLGISKKAQSSLNTFHKSVSGTEKGHFSINQIHSTSLLKKGGKGHQTAYFNLYSFLFL